METLTVFGFGSYFAGADDHSDIDLLLVHQSASTRSCQFAIASKRLLIESLPTADVVMLSEQEADEGQFVVRSGATVLRAVSEGCLHEHVRAVVEAICSYRSK